MTIVIMTTLFVGTLYYMMVTTMVYVQHGYYIIDVLGHTFLYK
jgi:hypothetical protein